MMSYDKISSFLLVFLCVFAALPQTASASVLERVLQLLDAAYPHIKASGISANIAENTSNPIALNQTLKSGDSVVIGYDVTGTAIFGTADALGVLVAPAQAAALGSGVNARLYPIGSALYSLPPAGQLSIFEQASNGDVLSLAQETVMTRIDGSITNLVMTVTPTLAPDVTAFGSSMTSTYIDFSEMGSTALGAVNAGEIITNVQVLTGADALGVKDIGLALLNRGPNESLNLAVAGDVLAISSRINQMGGSLNESVLSLNLATNSSEVTGRVQNTILGLNARVDNIVTTAIGAVNGGSVSN
jgi:hypothetical protein